ncbi:(Fe-S)-binding protein [Streptomyces massasporeus]|uniref:(Fe-S)-binding protein n=1 Tax=Streptomyces massasporeus TaxID=67324 RepID=UPI00381682B1
MRLACKGCKTDCPVNVDMATYKAEFLHHHHKRRLRPLAHYSMGWLPAVARLVALAPRTVNALTAVPRVSRAAKALGWVAPERGVPVFVDQRFTDWWRERGGSCGEGHRGEVVVWPDTFTDHFHPAIGRAAVEVLEAAGFRVKVPEAAVCCGLTWISTGQLDVARRVLGHTIDVLREDLRRGTPVVGLEPSCTAVFRADAAELLPKDPDVDRLRGRPAPWPNSSSNAPTTGSRRASTHARWSSATVTSTPSWASTPTGRSWNAPGWTPTSWTPVAAAWQATSASRRATTTSPWRARRRDCCPPCARRTTRRWFSRTASAAVRRSTRPAPDAPHCTWRKCRQPG